MTTTGAQPHLGRLEVAADSQGAQQQGLSASRPVDIYPQDPQCHSESDRLVPARECQCLPPLLHTTAVSCDLFL